MMDTLLISTLPERLDVLVAPPARNSEGMLSEASALIVTIDGFSSAEPRKPSCGGHASQSQSVDVALQARSILTFALAD